MASQQEVQLELIKLSDVEKEEKLNYQIENFLTRKLWELSQNYCNSNFLGKVDHEQEGDVHYEKF